jgi:N6-adenosine-specific RNA methylase IME4
MSNWKAHSHINKSTMSTIFDISTERERKRRRVEKLQQSRAEKDNESLFVAIGEALDTSLDAATSIERIAELERSLADKKRNVLAAQASALDVAATQVFGTTRRYSIIYADPPWSYYNKTLDLGTGNQYATMSDAELARLPVYGLGQEDSVLLLWATQPMMRRALSLMASWGYEFTTFFLVWNKVQRFMQDSLYGRGAYTRPNSEFVLLGMRGKMRVGERNSGRIGSVLRARPREHSRKPPIVREMIVRVFGDLPRIELFARQSASDWDVWGNETERFETELGTTAEPLQPIAGRARRNNLSAMPRRLVTKQQSARSRGDRLACVDKQSAAYHELRPSNSTSMTKLDYCTEEGSDEQANDRDTWLYQTRLLESSFALRDVERHALYVNCSDKEVQRASALVRKIQDRNADRIFALNYNRAGLSVRLSH